MMTMTMTTMTTAPAAMSWSSIFVAKNSNYADSISSNPPKLQRASSNSQKLTNIAAEPPNPPAFLDIVCHPWSASRVVSFNNGDPSPTATASSAAAVTTATEESSEDKDKAETPSPVLVRGLNDDIEGRNLPALNCPLPALPHLLRMSKYVLLHTLRALLAHLHQSPSCPRGRRNHGHWNAN